MTGGGEYSDQRHLLRSNSHKDEQHDKEENPGDLESQVTYHNSNNAGFNDLVKYLGRGFSARRLSFKRLDRDGDRGRERSSPSSLDHHHHPHQHHHQQQHQGHYHSYVGDAADPLGDSAPPEWALLLIGCLLGVASGLFVAAFNGGVHVIHEWAWAGTPNEGAAWLRMQSLADTWHRILLVPVTGGVIVGMMHGLLEILNQIRQSSSSQQQGFSLVAGVFPTVKAIQAAITLGTGCSLGPEGPSVDIGKSCANGFSLMMENNRERKIALVAAGAASGIASGFNAAVAGCFFAIETVLRPLRAENSPPFTTAMIILASVISSTVSNAVLGTESAFTVPSYDLKSAAELPLYLILGMLCGVVSVVFARLVSWFTAAFEYIKEKLGLPTVICPALGGLGAGIIALRYPGILYWGFTNVNEILHTGKSASAPGIWLLTQLAAAKVVATALCKGSGLVGGLYAPSLMIGAAVGAVFGGSAAELINSAIPGNAAVAQPQAYALVGMAATLASVCSVPLTSVLLLFELTKDYRILLPLMVSKAMSKKYLKVSMAATVREAMKCMHDNHQKFALVVDEDEFLEGIITLGDIRRCLSKKQPSDISMGDSTADVNPCLVSSVCTKGISFRGQERGLLTCFADTDLAIARELMEASGVKQLPVVNRGGEPHKGRKRRVIAVLHYESIWNCLREEINHRKSVYQHSNRKDNNEEEIINSNGY
uniref:Chloride channel protein n=1 Tax=Gossypium raimondii TaxID=29730 RepID=A0A0D2SE86_GOSRA|nr:hypothetical protein B456_013G147500 [Gossypium raimondii]